MNKISATATLAILVAGLVQAQTYPACAKKTGDGDSATYCLNCEANYCRECHNGFVDSDGGCSPHAIANCWTAKK